MTMLNSLEKLPQEKRFFRFEGILPSSIGIRFHRSKPQDVAAMNPFINVYLDLAKEHQGVYRCSMQRLAFALKINPFSIPKILYNLQNSDEGDITYEVDQESFVLRILHIPAGGQTLDLSQEMLVETRRIERNMIQKLNCMYFVSRRISMTSIDHMLRKEKESGTGMYKAFSKELNELINLYFSVVDESTIEA